MVTTTSRGGGPAFAPTGRSIGPPGERLTGAAGSPAAPGVTEGSGRLPEGDGQTVLHLHGVGADRHPHADILRRAPGDIGHHAWPLGQLDDRHDVGELLVER